ncbi:hypothetical protein [Halalkalibacter flavus]|uniref:hypothetical protein n=1 Tax=Halalkalibacter flavus TaxID=3090668 RepID=UPI002FC9487E
MRLYISVLLLFLILLGCSNNTGLFDFAQLVEELEGAKVNYSIIENNEKDPFFSVPPKAINVSGEYILIYEYPTKEDMEKDASAIHPDGNIGNASISYISDPHYFKKGNIIVQYTGKNKVILQNLEKIFGKQFAGR